MTSRAKGTVYRLTLTFPLCINPLNLIYHTFLMNDIKMMIFLLLSRLWWGALLSPLRKTTNGSQSCLFPFACVGTMLVPSVGLPPGGQRGAAPSCKFPWAKGTGCLSHCSNEPLSWKHSQVGKTSTLPGLHRGSPSWPGQRLQLCMCVICSVHTTALIHPPWHSSPSPA